MHENIPTFLLFISLAIYIVLALWIGGVASEKGRNGLGWVVLSLFTSPLVAFLALLVVGETEEKKELENATRLLNERAMRKVLDEGFDGSAEALIEQARSRNSTEVPPERQAEPKPYLGPSDDPKRFQDLPLRARVALFICLGFIFVSFPIIFLVFAWVLGALGFTD